MPFHPSTHPQLARVADDVLLFEKKTILWNGTERNCIVVVCAEERLSCSVLSYRRYRGKQLTRAYIT